MFSVKESLQFININQEYLKYMNSFCPEIYYKPANYENKPYLGILLNQNGMEYVIPLTSAKEKHKSWKNVESDRFLIFENSARTAISPRAVFVENADGTVKHILSAIDLKKMFPVKEGVYSKVNLIINQSDSTEIKNYKNLMNKEFAFCVGILDSILQKSTKLYDRQMKTGKIIPFCCNFKLLEEKCKEYCID